MTQNTCIVVSRAPVQLTLIITLQKFKLEDRSREERIEITRHEFQRHIQQLIRSNIGQPNKFPLPAKPASCDSEPVTRIKSQQGYNRLVTPKICEVDKCSQPALPCAKHCTLHIMLNTDQVLFDYCTAKFADNTQCSVPVFDISHELPLCPEHARKRVNIYSISNIIMNVNSKIIHFQLRNKQYSCLKLYY